MPYNLIVIDMQYSFEASRCEATQNEVATHIKQAMCDEANIMFVEYHNNGPTIANLLILCADYDPPSWCVVEKWDDCGGGEVYNAMKKWEWNTDLPIRVCGVNLSACVMRTVEDLINRGYDDIVLLWHACNNPDEWIDRGDRYSDERIMQKYKAKGVKIDVGLCSTI